MFYIFVPLFKAYANIENYFFFKSFLFNIF